MNTVDFLSDMDALGVSFYTGVPDSLLKPLCDTLYARYGGSASHVVAANEGGAAGLAAGHYIATGKPALIYLQNSGIGNLVNPVASLLNGQVYGIPCVLVVGWRGEPGVKDEPQHAFQGQITRQQLELMGVTVFELDKSTAPDDFAAMLAACRLLLADGQVVAFLAHKGAFSGAPDAGYCHDGDMSREQALREILVSSGSDEIFVSTTGKTSREVFELRESLHQGHDHDFLTVGSMGHAGMIALGIALAKPQRAVWCLDGDGAALMHLGALAVEGQQSPRNLTHIVFNNGAHESVGGMPVAGGSLRFAPVARSLGFECHTAASTDELRKLLATLRADAPQDPRFVELMVRLGSRDDLGRPTQSPKQNLQGLMRTLSGGEADA